MRKKAKNRSEFGRIKRHLRIRKRILGTKEMPRLSVHRSHNNLYAQFIDDLAGATVFSVTGIDKEFKKLCPKAGNIEGAKKLGAYAAEKAKKLGIEKIIFDRGGYLYHGRIKAFADSARAAGLKF